VNIVDSQRKNRLILVAIVCAFLAPLLAALALRQSSWQPQKTRNSGTLIVPPRDITTVAATLADGSKLAWHDPQFRWTLLALPGTQCGAECRMRLDEALRMRLTLGRNTERLRVIYLGPPLPADFVAVRAPLQAGSDDADAFAAEHARGEDALALTLIDPNGLLMLRYPDGYFAQGLRSDIVRVIY
jgi:hypothetical protein